MRELALRVCCVVGYISLGVVTGHIAAQHLLKVEMVLDLSDGRVWRKTSVWPVEIRRDYVPSEFNQSPVHGGPDKQISLSTWWGDSYYVPAHPYNLNQAVRDLEVIWSSKGPRERNAIKAEFLRIVGKDGPEKAVAYVQTLRQSTERNR